MSTRKPRLDEILIREGLVTESQISQALEFQKKQGGRLGSLLLYHRFIDEASLVKALTSQQGCAGVVLSNLKISDVILKFIPARVAIARKIVPFDYDPEKNVLKIACEDPNSATLRDEVKFVAHGKSVQLFLAAEAVLNTIITKYYLKRDIDPTKELLLELPLDDAEFAALTAGRSRKRKSGRMRVKNRAILLIIDDQKTAPQLRSLLARDGYEVIVTSTINSALEIVGAKNFYSILIQSSVTGEIDDLVDRLHKMAPSTRVHIFDSVSHLLMNSDTPTAGQELLYSNLQLFTSMLSAKAGMENNHGGRVGTWVDKLCRHMELPDEERLIITNAGYLHDLGRFYYQVDEDTAHFELIGLTTKLLESLNYQPAVIAMLQAMYSTLEESHTRKIPIHIMGANMLTLVDIFCEKVPENESISFRVIEDMREELAKHSGKLFTEEVVDAFIEMIQEPLLENTTAEPFSQVMLLSANNETCNRIQARLEVENFQIICDNSLDRLINLIGRRHPDILIVGACKEAVETVDMIDALIAAGVRPNETPLLIITDARQPVELTALFERGVEDIVSVESNFDLLAVKILKIRDRLIQRQEELERVQLGDASAGRISDMNLIDLIQTMGPNRKSAKIVVTHAKDERAVLDVFLDSGNIRYASLGELVGPDAIYEALKWQDGHWRIEPVEESAMPEPNNEFPNDAILLEGLRRLDEAAHKSQQIDTE